jgi:hypothetical protein
MPMKVYAAMMDHRIPRGDVGGYATRMESMATTDSMYPKRSTTPSLWPLLRSNARRAFRSALRSRWRSPAGRC